MILYFGIQFLFQNAALLVYDIFVIVMYDETVQLNTEFQESIQLLFFNH